VGLPNSASPWRALADVQIPDATGMQPWWVCPGSSVRRSVFVPPLSQMELELEDLLDRLSLYRMALGQPDQEALIHALNRRLDDAGPELEATRSWIDSARINLGVTATD
jgi:hypothetical protein